MVVFIEYVLIDNFVIDYLLLKTTYEITGKLYAKKRLLLCAFFGALFALFFPLIENIKYVIIPVKILFGVLLILLANKYESKKIFYVNAVVFFSLTFLLGGAVIGIFNLFNIDYSSEISIGLMIIPCYVLIKGIREVISFIYRRKDVAKETYLCTLSLGKVKVDGNGFIDTGNNLYFEGKPVIVCGKNLALKLMRDRFPDMKKINYSTVSGNASMFCFNIDEIKIYTGVVPNIYTNVVVAVNKRGAGTGYDLILHPSLTEAQNEFSNRESERVS